MTDERDLQLRKFYAEQRDLHLRQNMSINGQGTFGALAIVGALLIGGLGLKKDNLPHGTYPLLTPFLISFGIGIGPLFLAGAVFSYFHVAKLRKFEDLVREPKEFNDLSNEKKLFQIMPQKWANFLVFFGLIFLIGGVLGIIMPILAAM